MEGAWPKAAMLLLYVASLAMVAVGGTAFGVVDGTKMCETFGEKVLEFVPFGAPACGAFYYCKPSANEAYEAATVDLSSLALEGVRGSNQTLVFSSKVGAWDVVKTEHDFRREMAEKELAGEKRDADEEEGQQEGKAKSAFYPSRLDATFTKCKPHGRIADPGVTVGDVCDVYRPGFVEIHMMCQLPTYWPYQLELNFESDGKQKPLNEPSCYGGVSHLSKEMRSITPAFLKLLTDKRKAKSWHAILVKKIEPLYFDPAFFQAAVDDQVQLRMVAQTLGPRTNLQYFEHSEGTVPELMIGKCTTIKKVTCTKKPPQKLKPALGPMPFAPASNEPYTVNIDPHLVRRFVDDILRRQGA